MIELRDYQQKAIDDIKAALMRSPKKSVICEMPTGGGKTVVFSYLSYKAIEKGNKVLILTDRAELLSGTGGTLKKFNLTPSYVIAGRKLPPDGNLIVAMAQTLKNRIKDYNWVRWFKSFNLYLIDEVHKQEFNKFFEEGLFYE